MNRQCWKVWSLSVAAALAACHSASAHDGRPSAGALQQMGLGGMAVMSDDESMDVRGMGYGSGPSGYSSAKASGNSFATINLGPLGGAHSENSYSSSGKNKAGGDNFSFAGVSISSTSNSGGHKPPKGGNGGYGNKPPMGGNGGYGGNGPPMGGNGGNGGYGGMGGGMGGGTKTTTVTFTVFAGGFSHAYAH